jgi:hypothetical protein
MFGYLFWWLRNDKPEPYKDQETKELPVLPTMAIGTRAPEDGWAERMRLERPPGRHS